MTSFAISLEMLMARVWPCLNEAIHWLLRLPLSKKQGQTFPCMFLSLSLSLCSPLMTNSNRECWTISRLFSISYRAWPLNWISLDKVLCSQQVQGPCVSLRLCVCTCKSRDLLMCMSLRICESLCALVCELQPLREHKPLAGATFYKNFST